LILLDSSAWIDIIRNAPRADAFRRQLEEADSVLVPTIVIYEVYKWARRKASERTASVAVTWMRQHTVAPLDERVALEAADFSLEYHLAMADAIVYATAQAYEATLVTGDAHFATLQGVEHIAPPG